MEELPTDMLKHNLNLIEAEADKQRKEVEAELNERKKEFFTERRQEVERSYLVGAQNEAELKQELRKLMRDQDQNPVDSVYLEEAENQRHE
jgi:hypothetical protein